MNNKLDINRNASTSAFGWEFQANAAIVLFIKNIERASGIRIEGAKEDIEIYLDDGNVIYGQAKANATNDPGRGASTRFNDALVTLAENVKATDCEQILYVTNDDYPLGKSLDYSVFHGGGFLLYDELTPDMRSFVSDKANSAGINQESLNKFGIFVVGFVGKDPSTRHKCIMRSINELIGKLGLNIYPVINEEKLRDQWGQLFQENAADTDMTIHLDKEDFIWPIIVMLCSMDSYSSVMADYDSDLVQEIIGSYASTITYQTQRFEFITKLLSDFGNYASRADNTRRIFAGKDFISQHWPDYVDDLGLDAIHDKEDREVVMRAIMHSVLRRESVIGEIRRGVNLDY